MTGLADLTPAERRQIRAGAANTSARGASPLSREKGASPNGILDLPARPPAPRAETPIWRCHTCQEPFTALAAAQRHCDTTGHRRLEWVAGKERP